MGNAAKTISGKSGHKRKTHTKSRRGCENCKIRRVKCDEARPRCQKCISYGIACDYTKPPSEDSLQVTSITPPKSKVSIPFEYVMSLHEGPTISMIPDTNLISQLKPLDLDMLRKFQDRTILTIGTPNSVFTYRQHILRLASTKPFLLHLVLTLTLMHERFLHGGLNTDLATAEAFHWYRGTACFNELLTRPVEDADKDALWASAALLGAIAFASIRARTAEESWPLAPPSIEDLEWLKMSDGKKAVFKIANPYRANSGFKALTADLDKNKQFMTFGELDPNALPYGFIEVFDLNDPFFKIDSPYYGPILILSRLMTIQINHHTILKFLTFTSYVNPEYKRLLELKEPRALVVLAWWFTIVLPYRQWWIQKRVRLECQAICLYLERHHPQEIELHQLLLQPRKACGLDQTADAFHNVT